MKYSQQIGILGVAILVIACFMPWSLIVSQQITVSGFEATGTNFGKPGLVNLFLGLVILVLFVLPQIWAKRLNLFLAAFNLAWSVRNYLLVTACLMGECPEKKMGIYLLIAASVLIQVMALLPKMDIKK